MRIRRTGPNASGPTSWPASTSTPTDEDGMTTTEIAVITFLLVGAAIVVMGIIYTAAKGNADNIPEPSGSRDRP